MAEEQRWQQQPGAHRLCANNCGFFGNPTTLDLCSKCYQTHQSKTSKPKFVVEKSLIGSEPVSMSTSLPAKSAITPEEPPVETAMAAKTKRCAGCKRRVGLTGFTCRCGTLFCGTHRYPEVHRCPFDFKKMGKEAIAKANPLIKGEKLQKI